MSQNKNASSNLRRKLKESQTALENINPLVFTPDSTRFATEVLTHFSPTMFHFHTPWKRRERKSRAENSIGQPKTLRVTIKVTHIILLGYHACFVLLWYVYPQNTLIHLSSVSCPGTLKKFLVELSLTQVTFWEIRFNDTCKFMFKWNTPIFSEVSRLAKVFQILTIAFLYPLSTPLFSGSIEMEHPPEMA